MDDATTRPTFLCPMDGTPLKSLTAWYEHNGGAGHRDSLPVRPAPTPEEEL